MATAPRPQGGSSHRAATQPAPPPSIAHRVVNDEPISLDEYLEREQESEKRHEYVDGWMISMVAARWSHSAITSDIDRTLDNQLLDTDCRTASRDLKVAPPSADKNAFPDLGVVCGGPEFDPDQSTLLLNPRIVVEVLSPSTMDYDRGEKFARYRPLDSLPEYLLVAQDEPYVEHYIQQDDESWRFTETDGLDATITCPSVEAELPLPEVYLDVLEDKDSSPAE